jgi:predicted adenine nucleotide alpha hydrolase (AANH) superfamily ATPase
VIARIPVFAVFAAVKIVTTVRACIGPCHFDAVKINFLAAFETKIMFFFYFWNIHMFPRAF